MQQPDQTFSSAFDALADTPQEAARMRIRAELARALVAVVRPQGWTQAEAARHCGVTQPRMDELLRGRISQFSLDALVNMAVACGRRVRIALEAAAVDTRSA